MIVITGAAGFIGSCLVSTLNEKDYKDLILVDDFSKIEKEKNLKNKIYSYRIDRDEFIQWLFDNHQQVDFIYHIGARTDTTEFNKEVFDKLNLNFSKDLFKICSDYNIPIVYASSAATYGMGEFGYDDNHEIVSKLQPLNPYGESKNDFDKWVLEQNSFPSFWAGMKFFNVYGPNEYHKNRMASVIFHAYKQILDTGSVKLFKSHKPEFKDGEQLRDFIYVKDVVSVLIFMMKYQPKSGLFNLGTGKARSFVDLVKATFNALGKEPVINFIDTPSDIRDKYQYFTEANMDKLLSTGYSQRFAALEDGINDYVINYLSVDKYL